MLQLQGNAAFVGAPGELPVLLGAANSTLQGLPGFAEPGAVVIIQDQYVATQQDCENAVPLGNALLSQAHIIVQDLCDDPETFGCSDLANELQFTAAGPMGRHGTDRPMTQCRRCGYSSAVYQATMQPQSWPTR